MTWRFPTLEAKNLEGEDLLLPGALAGDPSIVIVAFRRSQQREVDTWLPWLESLRKRLPGLEVYELPTIKRRWLPARGLIDGGMRAGIPAPGTRQRTLTAYTDVGALTSSLRITSTSTIALVVVSRVGTVVWSGRGAYDPAAAADLQRAATAARNNPEGSEV
jgi:hypothetical protein